MQERRRSTRIGSVWGALAGATLLVSAAASCSSGTAATSLPPMTGTVDADRAWGLLEEIVAFGPRPSGTPANDRLRDWIVAELEQLGLAVERESFTADTPRGEIAFENLVAEIPAAVDEPATSPVVVLASHFDTKRFTDIEFVGANDGGSSTALLLELARVLAGEDRPVTYRLVFFDGEESVRREWKDQDNLYGSRHHVQALADGPEDEFHRVKACVLLDMVGDAELQLCRDRNSTPALLEMFSDAAEEIGLERHVGGISKRINDDHQSFLRFGIPAVDLIDAVYGPYTSRGLGAYWHTEQDTLDKCSADSLGIVGRIVLAGLPRIEAFATAPDGR